DPVIVSDRAILSLADIALTTDATLTFSYQSDVDGSPLPDLVGVPHISEKAEIDLAAEFRKIPNFKAPDDFKITVKNDVPGPGTLLLISIGAVGVIALGGAVGLTGRATKPDTGPNECHGEQFFLRTRSLSERTVLPSRRGPLPVQSKDRRPGRSSARS